MTLEVVLGTLKFYFVNKPYYLKKATRILT